MKHKLVCNNKKLIWKLILLIIGISLWIVAIINQADLSDYHSSVSVRYKEPMLTAQMIDNITSAMIEKKDNNIPEITLWQRDEDILIMNELTNTSVRIGLITVAGDMTKVYPGSMLYGGYLSIGDDMGCIVDRDTAYKLFGSENAVGLTISLDNKDYTVSGIMRGIGSNTMIIQEEKQVIGKKEGINYSCMELVFSDTDDAKRLAQSFIQTNALGTPTTYIDGYLYQRISYLLIHLPLWFSAMLLIIYLVRKVNALKASRVLFVGGWLGIILICAILIRITNVHFYFSSSMIPTRWSDFDFWGNQWRLLVGSLGDGEGSILYYKDMMLRRRMVFVLSGVILAVLAVGEMLRGSGSGERQ